MGLFNFLRSKPPSGNTTAQQSIRVDQIFAVPLAARKSVTTEATLKEKYIFYGFLFADSAEAALTRLRKELSDEGLEFIGLTGPVLVTTIPEWTEFVSNRFDWIKDALPTAQQIAEDSRGIVYYTPKITQY